MKIVFLDTETSGLNPGQICQLTYIVEDEGVIIKRVNQYMKVDFVEPGASNITGLTKERLDILSEGATFGRRAKEFYIDMNNSLIISHNIPFDEKFLVAEMNRLGVDFEFNPKFCTMRYFTNILKIPGKYNGQYKWPKVQEVMQYVGVSYQEVIEFTRSLFGDFRVDAHDARYDTVAVYLFLHKMRSTGKLNLLDTSIYNNV